MKKLLEKTASEIAELRKKEGLTLKQVADRTGRKNHQSVHQIEAGKHNISLNILEAFADALGYRVTIKFEKQL